MNNHTHLKTQYILYLTYITKTFILIENNRLLLEDAMNHCPRCQFASIVKSGLAEYAYGILHWLENRTIGVILVGRRIMKDVCGCRKKHNQG